MTTTTADGLTVVIRHVLSGDPDDRAFLAATAPRLETVVPTWVRPGALAAAVERSVLGAFDAGPSEQAALLIAEDGAGRRLGFAYLTQARNVNGDPVGYISELAVGTEAESRGVGRALIAAAEDWARERGYAAMTLDAYAVNERALALYEHLGYAPNALHLRKPL